jgi:hypothetical protein
MKVFVESVALQLLPGQSVDAVRSLGRNAATHLSFRYILKVAGKRFVNEAIRLKVTHTKKGQLQYTSQGRFSISSSGEQRLASLQGFAPNGWMDGGSAKLISTIRQAAPPKATRAFNEAAENADEYTLRKRTASAISEPEPADDDSDQEELMKPKKTKPNKKKSKKSSSSYHASSTQNSAAAAASASGGDPRLGKMAAAVRLAAAGAAARGAQPAADRARAVPRNPAAAAAAAALPPALALPDMLHVVPGSPPLALAPLSVESSRSVRSLAPLNSSETWHDFADDDMLDAASCAAAAEDLETDTAAAEAEADGDGSAVQPPVQAAAIEEVSTVPFLHYKMPFEQLNCSVAVSFAAVC